MWARVERGRGQTLLPWNTHVGWGHRCWLQRRRIGLGLFLWSHRCRCTMWWSRRRRQPYLVNWIPAKIGLLWASSRPSAPGLLPCSCPQGDFLESLFPPCPSTKSYASNFLWGSSLCQNRQPALQPAPTSPSSTQCSAQNGL